MEPPSAYVCPHLGHKGMLVLEVCKDLSVDYLQIGTGHIEKNISLFLKATGKILATCSIAHN